MPMTTTQHLRDAAREAHEAMNSTARRSRWPWVRNRAEKKAWRWDEYAKGLAARRQNQLIEEARTRVTARTTPARPWHRPDVMEVLDEVHIVAPTYVIATEESVARVIYDEGLLEITPEDLDLVEEQAEALHDEAFSLVAKRSYTAKPNGGSGLGEPDDADLVSALRSDAARLPRPVTVWRGEHPNPTAPSFTAAVRNARPGDVLERPGVISCSLDPAAAAAFEFSHSGTLSAPRDEHCGWILQITTERLLYAGSRNARSLSFDGIAEAEKEALLHAPELRVTGHRERLVRTRHGLRRVHVVSCTATQH